MWLGRLFAQEMRTAPLREPEEPQQHPGLNYQHERESGQDHKPDEALGAGMLVLRGYGNRVRLMIKCDVRHRTPKVAAV